MAFLGDPGFEKKATAPGFGVDFFGRKNEPIGGWFGTGRNRRAQHFVHVVEGYGGIESALVGGCAVSFQVVKRFVAFGRMR